MVNPDILKQIDKMLAADNTDVGDLAASDVTESQTDTQTDTQTDVQTDAQTQDQSVTDTPAQESNVTSSGNDDAQAGQVENVTSEGAKILGEDTAQNDFGDSTRGGDRDDTAATEADTDEEETSESSEENNEDTETDVSEEAVNEDTAESSTTEETVVADEPRIPIDTSKEFIGGEVGGAAARIAADDLEVPGRQGVTHVFPDPDVPGRTGGGAEIRGSRQQERGGEKQKTEALFHSGSSFSKIDVTSHLDRR